MYTVKVEMIVVSSAYSLFPTHRRRTEPAVGSDRGHDPSVDI
jgi:hypothetical protein